MLAENLVLADEIVESSRTHPHGKRSRLRQPLVGRVREQVSHKAEVCFACDEPGRDLLRDEAVGLLRELIRLDTVNPPGNETRAAEPFVTTSARAESPASLYAKEPSAPTSSHGFRAVGTARAWRCSRTPTRCSRIRRSGRSIPGRATCGTGRSGAAVRST